MMAEQETSGTSEPSLSEEAESHHEQSPAAGTETPALNRAERRAQAKGKKGSGSNAALPPGGGIHGASGRTSGHAGQVRFPRTGHK